MVRWTRFRSGLLLASVLWVACGLNPTPVLPEQGASPRPEQPGTGATSAGGTAGSDGMVIVPPGAGGGTTNEGAGAAPMMEPEGEVAAPAGAAGVAGAGEGGHGGAAEGQGGTSETVGGEGGSAVR